MLKTKPERISSQLRARLRQIAQHVLDVVDVVDGGNLASGEQLCADNLFSVDIHGRRQVDIVWPTLESKSGVEPQEVCDLVVDELEAASEVRKVVSAGPDALIGMAWGVRFIPNNDG